MRYIVSVIAVLVLCPELLSKDKVAQKPPLGWNSFDAFYATVTELITEGVDIHIKTNDGTTMLHQTPLYVAVDRGHTEIVELLRKHGAKE